MQLDKMHYTMLARQYAPASIIINDNNEVIHSSTGVEAYLQYKEGAPSRNLLEMVSPELQRPLKRMIFQFHQNEDSKPLIIKTSFGRDGESSVRLMVQPLEEPNFPDRFLQVTFSEIESGKQAEKKPAESGDDKQEEGEEELVEQLETELEQVKEQLHATVEQYEVSNEELRTSNEELQSMNEELQTTTEELETSKGEIHSVNEELRLANNELKNLMEATEVGIIFIDQELHIKRFTKNVRDLFNLVESDLGRPLSDITNKLAYDDLAGDIKQLLDNGSWMKKLVSGEDGRWYIMRLRPYRTTEDEVEGVVLTFVEITDLKQAEEALEYHAEQQEALARLGLYSLDKNELQSITDKVAQIVKEVLRADYSAFLEFDPDSESLLLKSGAGWAKDLAGMRFPSDRQLETGYVLEVPDPVIVENFGEEERFERSELLSDHKVVSCLNVCVRGKKAPYGVLGVYSMEQRSFTDNEINLLQSTANLLGEAVDRIRTESELQETNKKLKEAVRLRDEFLTIASHELQTPVSSLKAYSSIFEHRLRNTGDKDYAEQATAINKRVDQLSRLINKLLDVSRLQEGKLELEKEPFSLNELIAETVETRQHVSDHEIRVEGSADKEVTADRFRIGQVLSNLIDNAIKYSPDADQIIIRCKEDDDRVTVSVADFGIGIPDGDKERIFERFFKGEGDGRDTYPGFGVGLHISSQIIERHGGIIEVEENEPGGSVFSFSLPLKG